MLSSARHDHIGIANQIACAASDTAFSLDPQSLLIVVEGTLQRQLPH
ncbi:MAG: hypothetical protein U0841_29640 [Chloroflexia bacterium]